MYAVDRPLILDPFSLKLWPLQPVACITLVVLFCAAPSWWSSSYSNRQVAQAKPPLLSKISLLYPRQACRLVLDIMLGCFTTDKDHVFRMEECFCSSDTHSAAKVKHPVTMAAGIRVPMSSTVSPQTASSPPPSSVESPVQSQQVCSLFSGGLK